MTLSVMPRSVRRLENPDFRLHAAFRPGMGTQQRPEHVVRIGAAIFDNSYYQESQLLYAGKSWNLPGSDSWYLKLTGGLLHGCEEPYEDKIPFNGLGIAPVIIPALGFRYRWLVAEANLGGLAVVTFTAGVRF